MSGVLGLIPEVLVFEITKFNFAWVLLISYLYILFLCECFCVITTAHENICFLLETQTGKFVSDNVEDQTEQVK